MFESDRHFSHLSTLERELAFRTEMGLYYSYFKTMIEAPSVGDGINSIMYDNVTEYPSTINTLKRFNLYPEVLLGVAYRSFMSVMRVLDLPTTVCYRVNREHGKAPILSCEGLGEPSYFYIEAVFLLNGINMMVFFLFGSYLSGSVFGGLLTVMSFFYNHGECTRVQWTPPLRESFAYPFSILQLFLVSYLLRVSKPSYKYSILLAFFTVCFMLPWQFAQFALVTQTLAVFATYMLGFISSRRLKVILVGQGLGLLVSCGLLFGNAMLLTSFFSSCLVTITVSRSCRIYTVLLEIPLHWLPHRLLIWVKQISFKSNYYICLAFLQQVMQCVLLLLGTLGIKHLSSRLLNMADDAHIGDILRSKFTNFKNFHTQLYTCAAEFDFMERETPYRVTKTLLAPCSAVVMTVVVFKLVYHVFQQLAFLLMALMIMRLKLFWTPHLCLLTSLLASREFFGWLGDRKRHFAFVVILIGVMSVQGLHNLRHQRSIIGEFSNYPLEDLVNWINEKTPRDAVFAGPMPTMASIKLSTLRPIVNHPHYEDAQLRERTHKIYTMYSRKPEKEVWQHLQDLHVEYAILEQSWCNRRSRPGCGMAEIWDLEDSVNQSLIPVCARLQREPGPYFKRVFRNRDYDILKVLPLDEVKKP
ncbi:hypothetical protein CAPTEDRAFT_6584 [Capitella teleta]|uniref:C-mannosyltransferase DPY19L1 n=1 Tax=Capitella teleta TaxID=283909 RepID=R7THI4_CAPTE|nr:hypothetical protein CAPTEDRAFT_6584 [Capitella teleta]|eukprot:ELT92907.1 hypothetical protein CAPTEDRAFT_6584 [Capitella teleta]